MAEYTVAYQLLILDTKKAISVFFSSLSINNYKGYNLYGISFYSFTLIPNIGNENTKYTKTKQRLV